MNKRLLNVDEAAEYIGSTPRTMYQKVYEKSIPYVKIGSSVRFDIIELDAFIEKKKKEVRGNN